ncbi:MAG: carboxypeptidase regulatory-like domain-containing protein [Bacteroidota bacterium]|nr:MAG: carboxypeptidase regulatory-like domain-containing protein [Bacteroidota bacterium]
MSGILSKPGSIGFRKRHCKNEADNVPIGYATIVAKQTGKDKVYGTRSKENGSYTLKDLPSGEFEVTISSIGYQSKTIPINLTEGETKTSASHFFRATINN